MHGPFFNEQIIVCLGKPVVEYSISVPFNRYTTTIKRNIEERKRWRRLRTGVKFFGKELSLDSWSIASYRLVWFVIGIRSRAGVSHNLNLCKPHDFN